MSLHADAIGGYFEIELPKFDRHYYPDLKLFQSARAAFFALLYTQKPNKVWMPYFVCDSILQPLKELGISIEFYAINIDFSIRDDIVLGNDDLLFYVNYFGVCGGVQANLLKQFPPEKIVFDHSQAFYQTPLNCLATLFSPRKFFGVPDGGFLYTSVNCLSSYSKDTESSNRFSHLLKRLHLAAEDGYLDYVASEKTLVDCEPKIMSSLTEKILKSIDYEQVKELRNINFLTLHAALGEANTIQLDLSTIDGPMGYPFLTDDETLRRRLIEGRIFVPTYWVEVKNRVTVDSVEMKLLTGLNLLPCDQRYSSRDMFRIIEEVVK